MASLAYKLKGKKQAMVDRTLNRRAGDKFDTNLYALHQIQCSEGRDCLRSLVLALPQSVSPFLSVGRGGAKCWISPA